ncbi:MAG: DMT family transporter [Deltaproteobacteria bacterium]|nr:DMT family transporter [Deltaproteobacteria bacterium]
MTMVWAGLMPTGKIALRGVPPMTIAAIRMVIGSSLLSLYLRRDSRPIPWSPRLVAGILALGFCGYMVSTGGSYYGLRLTTVTNAALLNAASPVSLALLSVVILKERLPSRSVVGILLSVIGVAVIITRGSWDVVSHSQYNLGDIILLSTQLSWSLYSIYGRRLMEYVSPLAATTFTYMAGGCWLILGSCFFERDQWHFADVSWASWAAIAYQSTLGSFAHFWFYDAIAVVGPSRAGIFLNLVPVMAIGIAYFILGEPVTPSHLIGGAIVISGILVATRR